MGKDKQQSKCIGCGNKYPKDKFQLCPACDTPLSATNSIKQESKGKSNQTIQVGGDNKGNIIINTSKSEPSNNEYQLERTYVKPLLIGNKHVKSWWLSITGAIGFIGSLASIVGLMYTAMQSIPASFSIMQSGEALPIFTRTVISIIVVLLISLIFTSIFVFSKVLKHRKFFYIPLLKINLEVDKNGRIYKTKIIGKCGICNGSANVRKYGPEDDRKVRIVCTENPDHHWDFDKTELQDLAAY